MYVVSKAIAIIIILLQMQQQNAIRFYGFNKHYLNEHKFEYAAGQQTKIKIH